MQLLFLMIIIGYTIGCLHGSQIVGKIKDVNIKMNGMKNSGASNATLLLGWRYGLIVAMVDIGKAILSLLIALYIIEVAHVVPDVQILYLLANGLFVIIGHNFPITMKFDGGKGTASFFGLLLFLNWKFALVSLLIALIVSFITNYFVLGTLSGYFLFNVYIGYLFGKTSFIISVFFTFLFLVKHRENFKRMLNNEEIKLSSIFRKEVS